MNTQPTTPPYSSYFEIGNKWLGSVFFSLVLYSLFRLGKIRLYWVLSSPAGLGHTIYRQNRVTLGSTRKMGKKFPSPLFVKFI